MNNLLSVYNICGILTDNTEKYVPYLQSIVDQNFGKVVVSACLPNPRTIPYLKEKFPDIDFIVVNQNLPVNITFNYAVLKSIQKYGPFKSYGYISADSYCTELGQLEGLYNTLVNHPSGGIVCPRLTNDSGYAFGLRMGQHRFDDLGASLQMFMFGDYVIPVGKAVNGHTVIYSDTIQNYYGKCIPDIFKGFCTESVLSFVCGAVGTNWIISHNIVMGHDRGLDGPSAGQDVQKYSETRPSHDHPFYGDTLLPVFTDELPRKLGLGYEECQGVVMHDESQWDEKGHCKNDDLKKYIRDNVYLTKDKFDYDLINGGWYAS